MRLRRLKGFSHKVSHYGQSSRSSAGFGFALGDLSSRCLLARVLAQGCLRLLSGDSERAVHCNHLLSGWLLNLDNEHNLAGWLTTTMLSAARAVQYETGEQNRHPAEPLRRSLQFSLLIDEQHRPLLELVRLSHWGENP
jgi:hypothetical protein